MFKGAVAQADISVPLLPLEVLAVGLLISAGLISAEACFGD